MPKRSEQTNTILTLLVELEKGKKSGEEKGWIALHEEELYKAWIKAVRQENLDKVG